MWAEWLRQGLASGRTTTSYPRAREEFKHSHPDWFRLPASVKNCSGCRSCLEVCPNQALRIHEVGDTFRAEIIAGRCLACNRCLEACPEGALSPGDLDRADKVVLFPNRSAKRSKHPGSAEVQASENVQEKIVARALSQVFRRSLHIRHIDTGSCNACEAEILTLTNPYYNLHRLGFFFTPSPRHADVLLVTGALTLPMRKVLLETYAAMPRPRFVIACGTCALSGGVFAASPRRAGSLADILPVDVTIPGCPPNPYALLHALTLAAGRQEGCDDR